MEFLQERSDLLGAIRAFFRERDFLEVTTPVRVPTPALEPHIIAVESEGGFLRTSPELHMKRLVAAGARRIFQIGPCFRAGEAGPRHNPEFTMLEWYESPGDDSTVLATTRKLLSAVGFAAEMETLEERTVASVFLEFAGWDPTDPEAFDPDRFDLDLVDKVEPKLPPNVVLRDYPAPLAALARLQPEDPRVSGRWELYLHGVEVANAYAELTDPVEQRMRFENCSAQREALGQPTYALDEPFLEALAEMPPTGGIAIGIDRLLMLRLGLESLDALFPFR